MKKIEAGCLAICIKSRKGFTGRTVKVLKLLKKGETSDDNIWHVDFNEPFEKGKKGWRAMERLLMRIDGHKGKAKNKAASEVLEEAV
ncbi:hypothetical protein [Endozoicomonas sp. SESOKO3]|uniref:hypothetical protein n=1 Tax=Endozoicomonas sp. SESOKO3 TaxID=2828744 RepID=UPI0021477234|nr:hypothetical protein [Endozoicomonas sp. SESOKO3]